MSNEELANFEIKLGLLFAVDLLSNTHLTEEMRVILHRWSKVILKEIIHVHVAVVFVISSSWSEAFSSSGPMMGGNQHIPCSLNPS